MSTADPAGLGPQGLGAPAPPHDSVGLCQEARRLLALGEVEQALQALLLAVQQAPSNAHVFELLGVAHGRAGRLGDAAAALERAVVLEPYSAVTHYNLAVIYHRFGRLREAAREYGEALRLNPGHERARSGLRAIHETGVAPAAGPALPLSPELRPPPQSAPGGPAPSASPAAALSPVTAGDEVAGKRCSICQTAVGPLEPVVLCPGCGQPYHAECWQETGGCGSYGCAYAPHTPQAPPATAPTATWGDTKVCPLCFQVIHAAVLQCPYCREDFGTVEPLDRRELLRRRDQARRATEARTASIAIVAACLFCPPVVALVGGYYLVSRWKEPLGRIEPLYRILATVGVVVATLVTVVGIVMAILTPAAQHLG